MPAPRRWRRRLLVLLVIAAATWAGAIIFGAVRAPERDGKLTHTIQRRDLVVTITAEGTLESAENVEIKCKVRGAQIPIIWLIENGSTVKPGDVLVRLETLEFEDRFTEMSKWTHMTESGAAWAQANVAEAELAIPEYENGRYRTELTSLEKDLAIGESSLRTAQSLLSHVEAMAEQGYASDVDVEEAQFAVTQAKLSLDAKRTEIEILKNHTKSFEMESLRGDLNSSKARLEAETSRLKQVTASRDLASRDIENCVVRAEKAGMVIYPQYQPWEWAPKIQVGASVYMGQTMLLMPDLSKMQVKVGIPEAVIHRIAVGMDTKIKMHDKTLDGKVLSVASSAAPAKWWTGNVAKYETIVSLPRVPDLNPGMSAEVEVIVKQYRDVLAIPVAAIVETEQSTYCWTKTPEGPQRRPIELGDTNDVYAIVKGGLKDGDEVFLNPIAFKTRERPASATP